MTGMPHDFEHSASNIKVMGSIARECLISSKYITLKMLDRFGENHKAECKLDYFVEFSDHSLSRKRSSI